MSTTSTPPTSTATDHPTGPGDDPGAPPRSLPSRLAIGALFAVTLLVLAVVTIFRFTASYIQADGVQQSIMSVQNVDLFFWGQNRFAAVVSFLASPFADPSVNLFVCLLINASCFFGLLLILSRMGVGALTGERSWTATYVLWLILAAVTVTVMAPAKLHIISLESQPYSMSWLLTLGAYLLWKRTAWWSWVLAAGMVGVAMGLNPTVITGAAFLAVIEMVRRRQWVRWPALGAVFVVWFGIWQFLSSRLGGNAGPIPDAAQEYFTFDRAQFIAEFPQAVGAITGALGPTRLMVLVVLACGAVLLLPAARRATLLPRFAMVTAYVSVYFVVFAGNPWVSANGYAVRYFFPVLIALMLSIAAPIAGALLALPWPRPATALRPVWVVGSVVAVAAALAGPFTAPTQADVLRGVRATADYAEANQVSFLSGFYWDMWPLLWDTLDQGRDSHFVTAFKSGGDPAAYKARFEADLASGTPPRALCVNETDEFCQTYLDYWTAPGWQFSGQTCPVPEDVPLLASPPQRSCRVLEYTGQG